MDEQQPLQGQPSVTLLNDLQALKIVFLQGMLKRMLATEKRSEEQEQVLEQLQVEVKQQTTNADRKLRDAQTQLQSQAGRLCLPSAFCFGCSNWAAMRQQQTAQCSRCQACSMSDVLRCVGAQVEISSCGQAAGCLHPASCSLWQAAPPVSEF